VLPAGKLTPAPAKVTVVPDTGLLFPSFTTTTSGLVKLVPTCAVCPDPETTATLAAAPAVPVSEKVAGLLAPVTVAVTVIEPTEVGCAVTCATPLLFVTAVAPDGKLTPVPAKVTVTPEDGVLPFITVTTNGLAKFVPTAALWPEPEVTVMFVPDAGLTVTT
jgi:hypothetical protein